ncbi:MAG: WD40 domain-containing protein [Candidatus Hodarchaeales archaeon]|jgi:WD40 repeat protein
MNRVSPIIYLGIISEYTQMLYSLSFILFQAINYCKQKKQGKLMKRLYNPNTLFSLIFLVSLGISMIMPVHWLRTPEGLLCQVASSRVYQQDLEYQLEAAFEGKLGIKDTINHSQKGKILLGGKNHGEKMRITRLNPPFGEELPYTFSHTQPVKTIAFSPDGSLLASGGEDNLIKLWDVTLGTEILTLPGHVSDIRMVTFSPDGTKLASASEDDIIKIWSTTSWENIRNLTHTESLLSLAFSPDGKLLVSGDWTGYISIWNTTNWKEEPKTKKALAGIANYIDFSPDGKLLAACGAPKTIKIWNTTELLLNIDSEPIFYSTEHSDIVNEVKFSPDGKMLASACSDSKFWLWDLDGGNITYKYNEHDDKGGGSLIDHFSSIAFSPIGSLVASGGEDSSIRLWDAAKNITVRILSGHETYVSRVVFSPDGTLLASSSKDKTIKLWNVARGAKKRTFLGHEAAITSITYSPNGELLASGSEDNSIKLWNITSSTELQTLNRHEKTVTSVAFSPSSSLLASASRDSNIILWNTTTYQVKFILTNHTGPVHSVAFSFDGTMLASGGASTISGPEVRIWNVTSGEELQELVRLGGHSSPVTSVAFFHDGTILASGSEDGSIIIWNTTTWNTKQILLNFHEEGGVKSMVFSPIDTLLATCGEDNTIRIMNVTSEESTNPITGHSSSVLSVYFSPDGKILASGSVDGTIRLWNMSDAKDPKKYFLGHKFSVNSLNFSPDGKTIASGGSDSTITLWGVNTIPDFDEDGMPDDWEMDFSLELDPSDYWDKFHDDDDDGLMNSLEYFLRTYPNDTDSEYDGMPDGWEFLGGLDPTIDDATDDSDNDGLPALYEYQMGLNPRVNDAALDKDNDTLTNYQEFLLGLNATNKDSDYDGMLDGWEDYYDLNPRNGSDANGDPDGDWVINFDEHRYGSDPQNFWSVPLFALSAYLLIRVMILLIIAAIGVVMFLNYRNNQRKAFITSLAAPDYATALKVQKSGYTDYPSFVQAVSDAETLVGKGIDSYYQGDPVEAIQQLERSLTLFERTGNDKLVARTIFQAARIQKERRELAADSSILKLFPKPLFTDLAIKAIDHMLQALLAENERNWGLANNEWQAALSREELDIDLRIICQGALLESEVRTWLENPIDAAREPLLSHLDEWQEACQINQQFPSLCQAYLLHARVSFASFLFEEAEKWLKQCSETAGINKLLIYQNAVRKEKAILLRHKKRIEEELAKPISPQEQAQVMQEYITEALEALKKERLI